MTPSLAHRNEYPSGFWSKNCNHVGYNQLQKFWSELSPRARRELLRIDKQTLFEQARKNMYCSRCNGLLLECFSQIVTYGKSLRHEGLNGNTPGNADALENQGDCDLVMSNGCPDETQDPAVYQWGGLTTTRDGLLTLLTCYLYAKSFKGLQKVFDGARDRERESEVLYPDACGVGGRGWISQGMMNYGRGLGAREKCALHTARLSCDTLVDFWSALGEETRQSLLKMKEEDFIERLTYRFDSKRFCRDCRRNVIREFKELKELKRMRREPRCTTRFCAADTAFEYEVSIDAVQADWRQTFPETVGTYHHFEWAIGTEEGKSDILEFQNVGMSRNVQVTGLNLRGFSACYITLKAFKSDGRCSKICVKAHALRVQQCVHRILEVGDGYVSIKRGESVRELFEHAEEAEEEEDDDLMDRDGNELDGDCSRPQKHAKSPELAREFLLDAATVIFKEHVEKAFREGTARQNAHNIFVCLGLKLLEERFHVAFKEIITLEKQMKLLEEEEKEKREEEERKERKRTKEREKKLRRKERLKEKEKGKETDESESNKCSVLPDEPEQQSLDSYEDPSNNISCNDSAAETADVLSSSPLTPGNQDEQISDGSSTRAEEQCCDSSDTQVVNLEDEKCTFTTRPSTQVHRAKCWGETQPDPSLNWSSRRRYGENASYVGRSESRYHNYRFEVKPRCFSGSNRQLRTKPPKSNNPNGMNCNEKFQCCSTRAGERYDFQPCSCKHNESSISANKSFEARTSLCKSDSAREVRPKSKPALGQNRSLKDSFSVKKVWAPMETKKSPPCISDSDLILSSSAFEAEAKEHVKITAETPKNMSPCEVTGSLASISHKEGIKKSFGDCTDLGEGNLQKEVQVEGKNCWHSTDPGLRSSSSSDNCCSCLSDGSFSNSGKTESSSTSDSEGVSQQSEGQDNNPVCVPNGFSVSHEKQMDNGEIQHSGRSFMASGNNNRNDAVVDINTDTQHPGIFPPMINQFVQFPVFQPAPTISYYHQSPDSWLTTASAAGLTHYPHPNQYLYAGGHLGYSLNGEDSHLCMQYSVPPHHPVSPFVDSVSIPVFHEQGKANGVNTEERIQILEPKSTHKPVNGSEMGVKTVKPDNGNDNSFSLFHFDGPVALSSQVSAADAVASDHNAWESEIEEYNLFAANKGLNLSFL